MRNKYVNKMVILFQFGENSTFVIIVSLHLAVNARMLNV